MSIPLLLLAWSATPCEDAGATVAAHIEARVGPAIDLLDRAMRELYARRSFCPIWSRSGWINSAALDAADAFRAAELEGLDPRHYQAAAIARGLEELDFAGDRSAVLAELDVATTRGLFAYALDRRGRLDPLTLRARTISEAELRALIERVENAARERGLSALISDLVRRSPAEIALASALAEYRARGVKGAALAERAEINLERMRWFSGEREQMCILLDVVPRELILLSSASLPACPTSTATFYPRDAELAARLRMLRHLRVPRAEDML